MYSPSRGFELTWRSYCCTSLPFVLCVCLMRCGCFRARFSDSDDYWSNRQEVLLAIHRAVKAHRIPYAYANDHRDYYYYYNNSDEREWGGLPPLQLPLQPSSQRQQPPDPIDGARGDNATATASTTIGAIANSTHSSS